MKFCEHCENMMYVTINEEKQMEYYCKNCNHREMDENQTSTLIIDDNKVDDVTKYSHYLNTNIKFDPTLP